MFAHKHLWSVGETEHKQLVTISESKCCRDGCKMLQEHGVGWGSLPVHGEVGESLRTKVKDEYEPFTDEGWKGGTVCSDNSEQFAE